MKDKKIEVCDKCNKASCWYGEFMCDEAQMAGTIKMPISKLKKLGLEDKSYWSNEKLLEVYGTNQPI